MRVEQSSRKYPHTHGLLYRSPTHTASISDQENENQFCGNFSTKFNVAKWEQTFESNMWKKLEGTQKYATI